MNGRRNVVIGVLLALGLILLHTCSLQPGDLKKGVIALKVGVPGDARSLATRQYDVDSLTIEVYGPDGVPLTDSITWLPPNPQTYMVAGGGSGLHRVVVTHHGVNGNDTLDVQEELSFQIAPLKITTVTIIPGDLAVIDVEGCETANVSGYWVMDMCIHTDTMGDMVMRVVYYMEQDGSIVMGMMGHTGSVVCSSLSLEGDVPWEVGDDEEIMLHYTSNGTVDGGTIVGSFAFIDPGTGEPYLMEGDIPFAGDLLMERIDEGFGELLIDGVVNEYDDETGLFVLKPASLVTDKAFAELYGDNAFELGYLNLVDEYWIGFELETGAFDVNVFPGIAMSYSGPDFGLEMEVDLTLTRWDEDLGVAGSFESVDVDEFNEPLLTGSFDCPKFFQLQSP